MSIDNVGDIVSELETYDEWQHISFGYKRGKPCLRIHDANDSSVISNYIFLPDVPGS